MLGHDTRVTPVGATRARRVSARILSASHHDLPDLVARGRLREDLYYRLSAATLAHDIAPALVQLGRAEAGPLALTLLDEHPRDPFARLVLAEAAVASLPSAVAGPLPASAAALAEKGIALLEDVAIPRRTR